MADNQYSEKIDVFYGGMPDDIRMQNPEYSFLTQHFDVWTNPKRMTPYRNMVEDQDKTLFIINFLYALGVLFGMGLKVSSGITKIYKKSSDPITGSWTAATNGEDGSGANYPHCFLEFHGYAYGGAAGTRIWGCDLSGVNAFTATAYSAAGEPICQGIKTTDDLLLIPCASGIAKKDGAGSGPTTNWSLYNIVPASHIMTDICEIGDLVAIAAKPANPGGKETSKVFLWDKVSTDPSQVIDFGEGELILVDEIEGELIGIMSVGGNSSFTVRPKLVVRSWSGGSKALVAIEIQGDAGTSNVVITGNHAKVKEGNRIVFAMTLKIDGTSYTQLFAVGRKKTAYPLAVIGDRLVDNDVAITGVQGLGKFGGFYFIAHNSDGSVNRTNDQPTYTGATAVYVSKKLNGEGKVADVARRKKTLLMAGLMVAPLTSGQSVSLYYRTDGNTSWTLIRTYAYGDDAAATPPRVPANMGFESGIDAQGKDFGNYKELQFKATATGGAEPTAFVWTWKLGGSDVSSQ